MTEPNLSKKLARFAEVARLPNCIEVPDAHVITEHPLRGKWHSGHFGNANPITLELACGRGEYTVGQARLHPGRNFIGLDIKGNRIWKGAKQASEEGLTNAAFLRTRIDHIAKLFGPGEVSEIWVIFPDPQPIKPRKRLTSPLFIGRYRQLLADGGTLHLKTDSRPLYDYTLEVAEELGLSVLASSTDLYADLGSGVKPYLNDRAAELRIRTYYEGLWLGEGKLINYVAMAL